MRGERSGTATMPAGENGAAPVGLVEARDGLVEAESVRFGRHAVAACVSAGRYQGLQTLMEDVYLVTDPAGVIREANAAISGLFGGARAYILGKPLSAFVHADDRASLAALLARLARAGEGERRPTQWHGRLRSRRPGEELHVVARVCALPGGAEGEGGQQWLLRDVSATLAQAERLRALEQELERRVQLRTAELAATVRVLQARLGC